MKLMSSFLGVIALAGVFAIRKYLFVENLETSEEVVVGGCTLVKDANTIAGVNISKNENSDITLNELLHRLAAHEERKLEKGITFSIGNGKLTVLEMNGEIVTRVIIKRLSIRK